MSRRRIRSFEIDLSFESFNDHVYRDGSSLSASTATFNAHQLSLSIEINYDSDMGGEVMQRQPSTVTGEIALDRDSREWRSNRPSDEPSFSEEGMQFQEEDPEEQNSGQELLLVEDDDVPSISEMSDGFEDDDMDSSMSDYQSLNPDSPFFPEPQPHQGMSIEEINALPTMLWGRMHQKFNGGQKCSVCLQEYRMGDRLRVMVCLHRFHGECLDGWLVARASCPICRTEVNDS